MGDTRVACKITVQMLGEPKTYESSLNWPGDGTIHPAIIQFLERWYEAELDLLHAEYQRQNHRQNAEHIEREERKQLARLKAKYEGVEHAKTESLSS